MKKKLVIGIIFIILAIFNLHKVQAYSGEIDPENLITLPGSISVTGTKGTGTISVSASGYEISYQKIDISANVFNNIASKGREMQNYQETKSTERTTKEKELLALQKAYADLNGSATATEAQKTEARNKYETAYQAYEQFINTYNSKIEQYNKELYALIPSYTNSWTKTTNTSSNVNLDFSNYSGAVHFVLWAKITKGANTYYDVQSYSNDIRKVDTPTPTPTPSTPIEGENQTGEWTDFSKAKVNIEKINDVRKYKFTISNITPKSNHTYYYYIGNGTSTPNFSTSLKQLKYDESKKVLYSGNEIAQYLELGAEQYVYIYEQYLDATSKSVEKIVLNKTKLEKPAQNKYTDAFFATIISKLTEDSECRTQILFNTPWGDKTTRKVHLRIGKISDDTILKNIYNKKNTAFEDLLNYAKKANAFYDKTLNSNSDRAAGGIVLNGQEPLFNANNIINDDYYFLYAVVEDENGKYVKTEGVTFARANKITSKTFQLNFYNSADFTWKTFTSDGQQEPVKDDTTAKENLPQTGLSSTIVIIMGVTLVIGTVSMILYRRYKF